MEDRSSKNYSKWEELHVRLKNAQMNMEKGYVFTEERKKEILKFRAKQLAKKVNEEGENIKTSELLLFTLMDGEVIKTYAVDTVYISETIPVKEIVPLPCTPNYVLGIINVRGKILSVINIKEFLEISSKEISYTNSSKIIIAKFADMELGIFVEGMIGVVKVPEAEIQKDFSTLNFAESVLFKGVTKDRTVVIDLEKFLTDDRIIVHEEIDINI